MRVIGWAERVNVVEIERVIELRLTQIGIDCVLIAALVLFLRVSFWLPRSRLRSGRRPRRSGSCRSGSGRSGSGRPLRRFC